MIQRADDTHYKLANQTAIREAVIKNYPNEMCGVVVDDEFIELKNIAPNPTESFKVDMIEWLKVTFNKEPQLFVHSHTYDTSETKPHQMNLATPSQKDFEKQLEMNIPWAIIANEGENLTKPILFPLIKTYPLVGRDFVFYASDCYSILSDYYFQNFNIDMREHPEDIHWEDGVTASIYTLNTELFGFREITLDEIQVGDLVVMSIRGDRNHSGIYDVGDTILHHMSGRKSERLPFNKLRSFIDSVWRYKDL